MTERLPFANREETRDDRVISFKLDLSLLLLKCKIKALFKFKYYKVNVASLRVV